jgi:hypothetical protein
MLTQDQYNRLVDCVARGIGPTLPDIADLLESYERLHIELEALAATGASCVGVSAFDALFDDNGLMRVDLVVRGKTRNLKELSPRPLPYKLGARGWRSV